MKSEFLDNPNYPFRDDTWDEPEIDWITRLREQTAVWLDTLLTGSLSYAAAEALKAAILDRHHLLCDVIEGAYNFDARFEERLKALSWPLNDALTELRNEVEK